jgi:hypothetical protein
MIVFVVGAMLFWGSAFAKTFEVPLWPGPGVDNDRRVKSISEDEPCGAVATAHVSRLPEPDGTGSLRSERVVELSVHGKVLTTWPKPVNYLVFGVTGNQLLIGPFGDSAHGLLVDTDGDLMVANLSPNRTLEVQLSCPRIAAFDRSAYVRCWRFMDTQSHVSRLLAYEGPCT